MAANRRSWWQAQTEERHYPCAWEKNSKSVKFEAFWTTARNLEGEYRFQVILSLKEACEVISQLAEDGLRECPSELEAELQAHQASLVRLLACAAKLRPQLPLLQPEEDFGVQDSD